jgi:hypothetical protein
MRAGSLARQGKTLDAATVSGTSRTAYQANSFDPFDTIKGHLLDERYADTEEAALKIMANMSEEWKQSIVEQTPNFIEDLYDYKDGGGKAKEAQGMPKQDVIALGRKNRDRLTGLKGDNSREGRANRLTYTKMGGK